MSPPLTREADLRDQRLQRIGGQAVGWGLAAIGLAGVGAWFILGEGELSGAALVPPIGLLAGGVAVVVWSRGIEVLPDPELPEHAHLPHTDPRLHEALSVRRARWVWAATAWAAWMVVCGLAAWFGKDLAPGLVRMGAFLLATLPPTVFGARWLERSNGESGFPML